MKRTLLGAVFVVVGCGGATEAVDGAAAAEWRCLPVTSSGASLPCDVNEGVTCDCPSSCSSKGAPGHCVAPEAAAPAFTTCYEPANPLRAYACDTEADCGSCPSSCDVAGFDAGAGICK